MLASKWQEFPSWRAQNLVCSMDAQYATDSYTLGYPVSTRLGLGYKCTVTDETIRTVTDMGLSV